MGEPFLWGGAVVDGERIMAAAGAGSRRGTEQSRRNGWFAPAGTLLQGCDTAELPEQSFTFALFDGFARDEDGDELFEQEGILFQMCLRLFVARLHDPCKGGIHPFIERLGVYRHPVTDIIQTEPEHPAVGHTDENILHRREADTLRICGNGEGDDGVVPEKRAYSFEIPNIRATALTDGAGQAIPFVNDDGTVRFTVSASTAAVPLRLELNFTPLGDEAYYLRHLWRVLVVANGDNQMRQDLYERLAALSPAPDAYRAAIEESTLPPRVKERLSEVLTTQPLPPA